MAQSPVVGPHQRQKVEAAGIEGEVPFPESVAQQGLSNNEPQVSAPEVQWLSMHGGNRHKAHANYYESLALITVAWPHFPAHLRQAILTIASGVNPPIRQPDCPVYQSAQSVAAHTNEPSDVTGGDMHSARVNARYQVDQRLMFLREAFEIAKCRDRRR